VKVGLLVVPDASRHIDGGRNVFDVSRVEVETASRSNFVFDLLRVVSRRNVRVGWCPSERTIDILVSDAGRDFLEGRPVRVRVESRLLFAERIDQVRVAQSVGDSYLGGRVAGRLRCDSVRIQEYDGTSVLGEEGSRREAGDARSDHRYVCLDIAGQMGMLRLFSRIDPVRHCGVGQRDGGRVWMHW
jgi:hypothetical protein